MKVDRHWHWYNMWQSRAGRDLISSVMMVYHANVVSPTYLTTPMLWRSLKTRRGQDIDDIGRMGMAGMAWYGTIHLFCGLLAHDIVHPLIIQQSYGTSPYLIAKSYRINGYKWAISAMMSVGGYCIINPIIYSNYSPLVPFLLVKHG